MRIAYFTNQYPAVSHTFIRREIRALEAQGVIVTRYALRCAPQDLVDPEDQIEMKQTKYILEAGIGKILSCFIFTLLKQPLALFNVILLAAKI